MGHSGAPVVPPDRPAESARRAREFTFGNTSLKAAHFYENLKPQDGTGVIGTWSNRYAAGQAAITARAVGAGRVIYRGTYLTLAVVDSVMAVLIREAGVQPLLRDLPAGVEVTLREASDRQLLFVQNTRDQPVTVPAVPSGRDLLTNEPGPLAL